MTQQEKETALDGGKVFARMTHGRNWQCRRNGKTQVWKTRPGHFRIPIKFGFKGTGEITHETVFTPSGDLFLI